MRKTVSGVLNKRSPEIDETLYNRYAKLSKADWADIYFDLYRQVFGETKTDEEIMQDAERRALLLKSYRSS